MPRQKSSNPPQPQSTAWQQIIIDRIRKRKLAPLISNSAGNELVLGSHDEVTKAYAEYSKCPLENFTLAQIAQYLSIAMNDPLAMKEDYVNFVKNRLFDSAEQEINAGKGVGAETLAVILDKFDTLSISNFAEQLGFPHYENPREHPLLLLASFNLPIYITTCYHDFVESALRQAGKEPQADICRWHHGLKDIPSILDGDYEPSPEKPLVYHLHGLDQYPDSLVLSEDEYLKFLLAARQDVGRGTDPVHKRIRQAMSDSSLLLLGYSLRDWDFRSVFWGLIEPRTRPLTSVVSIQLKPGPIEEEYLQKYLSEYDFAVYWGNTTEYINKLYKLVNQPNEG